MPRQSLKRTVTYRIGVHSTQDSFSWRHEQVSGTPSIKIFYLKGIDGQVLKWFRCYPLDRKRFVKVDRVQSAVKIYALEFHRGLSLARCFICCTRRLLGTSSNSTILTSTFMLTILSSIWPLSLMQPNSLAQ